MGRQGRIEFHEGDFSDESDPNDFEYESSPFFDNKNHRNNRDKYEFGNNFNPIQIGTANASLPPLNRSDCGHSIASLLRDITYDNFAPLNLKIWLEMRGLETLLGLTTLLIGADVKRFL